MKPILILGFLLTISCAHSYDMTSDTGSKPDLKLSKQASFWVAVPEDGRFETQVYAGSGATTAMAVATALSEYVEVVEVGKAGDSTEQNLAGARSGNLDYVIEPVIVSWEERATEWSGLPDRISIRLQVIDAKSGKTLNSTVIVGTSRWLTLGGDHPQDLLPAPLGEYAEAIFISD